MFECKLTHRGMGTGLLSGLMHLPWDSSESTTTGSTSNYGQLLVLLDTTWKDTYIHCTLPCGKVHGNEFMLRFLNLSFLARSLILNSLKSAKILTLL